MPRKHRFMNGSFLRVGKVEAFHAKTDHCEDRVFVIWLLYIIVGNYQFDLLHVGLRDENQTRADKRRK